MITLNDALKNYCDEHKTEMPLMRHSVMLGSKISTEIRKLGKFISIDKVEHTETMMVNLYPDEFVPTVLRVVEEFYTGDKARAYKEHMDNQKSSVVARYFNFVVIQEQCEAFEAALRSLNMGECKNFTKNGKTQYKVANMGPEKLITLGIMFQAKMLMPENKVPENKPARKRIPLKAAH